MMPVCGCLFYLLSAFGLIEVGYAYIYFFHCLQIAACSGLPAKLCNLLEKKHPSFVEH